MSILHFADAPLHTPEVKVINTSTVKLSWSNTPGATSATQYVIKMKDPRQKEWIEVNTVSFMVAGMIATCDSMNF